MANPTNKTKDSFVPIEVDSVTVNLFFDGTKNNMFHTDEYDKNTHSSESSYANAYSNIAWMLYYRKEKSEEPWIYIQGIGTRRGDTDDELAGYAFGTGITGVVNRALEAFGKIETKVINQPSILYINVFGFSRGAATARHFIHLAKSNPNLFRLWKLKSTQIIFKFVGLFDTVSSYDESMSATPDFDNDQSKGELTLNFSDLSAADKRITKVFHIIAADEYRENFSVTNINSAVGNGFGYEVIMNGAHADVGGAYKPTSNESYWTTKKKVKDWLIEKNFYAVEELKTIRSGRNPPKYMFSRTIIRNDIHKVSLQMMSRMASKYGKLSFKTSLSDYYNNTTGKVKILMSNLSNEVVNEDPWKEGVKRGRRLTKTLPENTTTRALRHNYIHWSVQNKIGFGVRLKNSAPYRQVISG